MTIGIEWLPQTAFAYLMIFARVGTMLMIMPALGERVIPARIRLGFALLFTLMIYPLVGGEVPEFTQNFYEALAVMAHEIAVGFILGGVARLLVSAVELAGATIAFQIGLSVAQTANPLQDGVQGAIVGNFLSVTAMAAIFAMDLHHVILGAVYNSYMVYPVDAPLMFEDAAALATDVVARTFVIGTQMAAPFIVFGLVFYLGLGLLSKLMPQLQVFFIAMPANIAVGMILLALILTMMLGWYLNHFEAEILALAGQ